MTALVCPDNMESSRSARETVFTEKPVSLATSFRVILAAVMTITSHPELDSVHRVGKMDFKMLLISSFYHICNCGTRTAGGILYNFR